VTDPAAVAALIDGITDLTAVVHAAGVAKAVPADEVGPSDFADVAAVKVAGARNLDAVLGDRDLDAFVLFSSNAAVWGSRH
jgi:nucleoside-diphosphate-sugar epimerase